MAVCFGLCISARTHLRMDGCLFLFGNDSYIIWVQCQDFLCQPRRKKKWRRIIESAIQRTTHNAHIICDRTDIHVWHFFVFFIGRSVNTFGDSSLTSTSHFFLFIYLFSGISVPQSSSTFTVVSTQPMTSKNIKINRKTKKRNVDANFTIAFASSGLFRPNFTLATQ